MKRIIIIIMIIIKRRTTIIIIIIIIIIQRKQKDRQILGSCQRAEKVVENESESDTSWR